MPITRHFLDWHMPALHAAVEYFEAKHRTGSTWDLAHLLVVLPSARAGRRLRELFALRVAQLQQEGETVILQLPQVMTPGGLPEKIANDPDLACSELHSVLHRIATLQAAPPAEVEALFKPLPPPDGFLAWHSLAGQLDDLDRELSGEMVSFQSVRNECESEGLTASAARWEALVRLQGRFEAALEARGHRHCNEARRQALVLDLWKSDVSVVLLAVNDLPKITAAMLHQFTGEVVSLVHAPEELKDCFNALGQLNHEAWENRPIELADEAIHIVDRNWDEVQAVLGLIESLPGVPPQFITVGLGDEAHGGGINRALQAAGHNSRLGFDQGILESGPAQLLRLLADYAAEHRSAPFAALIRHPAVTEWLDFKAAQPEVFGEKRPCWLTLADEYLTTRLPLRASGDGPKPELAWAMGEITALWQKKPTQRLTLGKWCLQIGGMLTDVYGVRQHDPHNPREAVSVAALETLGKKLTEIAALDEGEFGHRVTFGEAVGFVLAQVGGTTLAPPGGEEAIELIGWLDAHLDDAPVLLMTGFNEGLVPQSVGAAPFLPDGLRRKLGLLDNRRRYASDAYLLSATVKSRPRMSILCARFSAQNDRLAPSRLLFAGTPDQTVARTLRFYGEEPPAFAATPLLAHGAAPGLAHIPLPQAPDPPIGRMSVTSFRDYIACPYRFYLKHVLKLRTPADDSVEMGADVFGNLAHDTLKDFGDWVIQQHSGTPPTDSRASEAFLRDALERRARLRFGNDRLAAVILQLHQLQRRLASFAVQQAGESEAGWQIQEVEIDAEASFSLDGAPFTLHGRIDRVDRHRVTGQIRILDYKTSENGDAPKKKHLKGNDWIDLQLPLYQRLAPQLGYANQSVEVGYITLPSAADKAAFALADWTADQLSAAFQLGDEIMRNVRAGIFWPPADPPLYPDGFEAICLDGYMGRAGVIAGETFQGEQLELVF